MFVKPSAGVDMRDPETLAILPARGAEVPETEFWLRRLRDGDVMRASGATEALVAPQPPALHHAEPPSVPEDKVSLVEVSLAPKAPTTL